MIKILLKIFVPSWRFFDDLGHVPIVFVRRSESEDWSELFQKPKFRWWHLFFNAQTNLVLFQNQLLTELMILTQRYRDGSIAGTLEFRLVEEMTKACVQRPYQFKVSIWDLRSNEIQDLLISSVYES